jgi:predicted  nucleic acid-binding Zn-ribbon protein
MTDQAHAAWKAVANTSHAAGHPQEDQIQALEVGLTELKHQNAQFNSWFQQTGERMQATENAVTAVQHTLNTHQNEIHALGSTFQSTMKTIKTDLSNEMNDSFNKQLSRLEALLEKKQRSN